MHSYWRERLRSTPRIRSTNLWHCLCTHLNPNMEHRRLKIFFATIISTVLVYYSVAWAVLRCFHDEDHSSTDTAVSVAGLHQSDFFTSPLDRSKADIGCKDWNYHTETLAGSSSPSQLRTLTTNIMQVTGFLALDDNAEVAIENLWLRALFDRASTLPFPTASPRYLSLSVLRI
jgi:hypothetical protein